MVPSFRGGLLGGASTPDAPKKSKLAALAEARRKKQSEKQSERPTPSSTPASVALLDRLGTPRGAGEAGPLPKSSLRSIREAKKENIKAKDPEPSSASSTPAKQVVNDPVPSTYSITLAHPSAFARTLLGDDYPRPLVQPTSSSVQIPSLSFAKDAFSGPSPDDVVANAQSAFKGLSKSQKPNGPKANADIKGASKKGKDVATAVGDLSLSGAPRPKSPKADKVDVAAEYAKSQGKPSANFVVIGHVDAGKSTLMGRLLHDLGVVDARTLARYQREAAALGKASFHLAWVLDQGTSERAHGVTMDVATNRFDTARAAFTLLDAPGHADFVPRMIAGAAQADFALLVLDASPNSFEAGLRGQTREHALLVRGLGVQRLVVAVNKMDNAGWGQARFDEIAQQTAAFLAAAGFAPDRVAFVPCSGLLGANVARRAEADVAPWYAGPSLLELLEAAAGARADPASSDATGVDAAGSDIAARLGAPFRMPISEIVDPSAAGPGGMGAALSIAGRVAAGSVQRGDALLIAPGGAAARVKALDVAGAPPGQTWAATGQNVVLHLATAPGAADGSEEAARLAAVAAGDAAAPRAAPVRARTKLPLKILAFAHVLPMFVSVVAGRLEAPARVAALVGLLNKGTGKEVLGQGGKRARRPRVVKPGEAARVVVEVLAPGGVPLEEGARVVLRSEGETVATGLVEAMPDKE